MYLASIIGICVGVGDEHKQSNSIFSIRASGTFMTTSEDAKEEGDRSKKKGREKKKKAG